MKTILMSIQPKWCKKIFNGEATILVRKTVPKETPFRVYVYCTKDNVDIQWKKQLWRKNATGFNNLLNGMVVAEFIVDKVFDVEEVKETNTFAFGKRENENSFLLAPHTYFLESCLTNEQLGKYLKDKNGYALHITDLKIYDKPKELENYGVKCKVEGGADALRILTLPPKNWQYVEEIKE